MHAARIVIVGGGGHARVAADVIRSTGSHSIVGYTSLSKEDDIPGQTRLGDDDVLPKLHADGVGAAFVAIGDNALRARIFSSVAQIGFNLPTFVHASAVVSPAVSIGRGTILMPGAIVNTGTIVGEGAIVNTAASVDHDCRIGDFAHIGPGCHLAGTVRLGEGAFLGVGASVIPARTIGAWSVLGAGAAVVRDIGERVVAMGVPARVVQSWRP